jgi:hypothetical protein
MIIEFLIMASLPMVAYGSAIIKAAREDQPETIDKQVKLVEQLLRNKDGWKDHGTFYMWHDEAGVKVWGGDDEDSVRYEIRTEDGWVRGITPNATEGKLIVDAVQWYFKHQRDTQSRAATVALAKSIVALETKRIEQQQAVSGLLGGPELGVGGSSASLSMEYSADGKTHGINAWFER